MTVPIGRLNQLVTLQSFGSVSDDGGGTTDTWSNFATAPNVWAKFFPLRGVEQLQAMQLESKISHDVVIRYRTDVTAKDRLLWGSVELNIRAVIPRDNKNRFLTLRCEQVN